MNAFSAMLFFARDKRRHVKRMFLIFFLPFHSTSMSKIHIKSFAIRYMDISEENNPENYNPQT